MPKDLATAVMTTKEICDLLQCGRSWLHAVAAKGYIKKAGKDRWEALSTVQGYLRHGRDQLEQAKREAEKRDRLAIARAADIEAKTAARLGNLIGTEEAIVSCRECVDTVREEAKAANLSAKFPDLADRIDAEFSEIFASAYARLDRCAEALRNGIAIPRGRGRPWNS